MDSMKKRNEYIVLFKFQTVDIQREVVLGEKPPTADFVVVRENIQQIMEEIKETTDQTLLGWYRDFMEQLSKLDSGAIKEAKRRFPEMAKTWRERFKPESDEWIWYALNTAVSNNTRTIYFVPVQDGEMRINYAARKKPAYLLRISPIV